MSNFLTKDFLLTTKTAKKLFHDVAADLPIIDYHCHLSPKQVADDYQFLNLTDIWLRGDHYKWRGMRTNGIEERFCTGDASDYDKFMAWARTVPYTVGNPLYHWTHLELKRPFGIEETLNEESADRVWSQCNEMLAQPEFSAREIMKKMNVKMVGTTDDPLDDLSAHKQVMNDPNFDVKMLPSWRPDKAFNIQATGYLEYLDKLSNLTEININSFSSLCQALSLRLDHFEAHGCSVADHALDVVFYQEATEEEINQVLEKRFANLRITDKEAAQLKTACLIFLGREYHKRGWVQQYHIGALRNNNERMFQLLGADIGFDSIHDQLVAEPLSKLLNALDRDDLLPKTILYCLNPRDNEVIATMCGNFQGGGIPGKIQFGSGWWFNDQKDGMIRQMEQLSQLGLLSRFVGMLTDSRSFLSYTRHEYFRRLLCRILGEWVENGEAPNDMALLSRMVEDICFENANRYFNLNLTK